MGCLGHGTVVGTWRYDEDADSLCVDVIEQQVEWAVPWVASEGTEFAWRTSTVIVSPKFFNVLATLDMGGVCPAIAHDAPGPDVAVCALWLAFFPGL